MTAITDPRTAGQLARYDVLRAAATDGDQDEAVNRAAAATVERLLAEHGAAGVVGLVAELTHEALLSYQHQAVAQRDRHLEPVAEMLERLWSELAPEALAASLDSWERSERRPHEARTEPLTAA